MSLRTDRPWTRPVLLAVFFFSGASGLVYEIAWMRRLTHVFGSTTLAVSTVLAAFMGGFALGAYRLGKSADRRPQRALAFYGLLEFGIAAAALAVPLLLRFAETAYLGIAPLLERMPQLFLVVQFLLVGVVLLVPTAMMGGTLPVLSRWLVTRQDEVAKGVAHLYAANTLGAGAGTAVATYFLLPTLGVSETEWIAVAANIGAGAMALVIDRQARITASSAARPESLAADPPPAESPSPPVVRLSATARALLAGIALSGFAAMVDEVAWSRVLALVFGSSVYSFGMMLLLFLVGLSIGSVDLRAHARLPARVGVCVRSSRQHGGRLRRDRLDSAPSHALPARIPGGPRVFSPPPALESSPRLGTPPALRHSVRHRVSGGGRRHHDSAATGAGVGRVTVANTVGTVLGAFCGGFVLIPHVGLRATLTAAALATGLAAFFAARELPAPATKLAVRIAAAAALLIAIVWPPWPLLLLVMGAGFYARSYPTPEALLAAARQEQLLFYKDGVATTLSVDQSGEYRYYRSNGKTDASTHPGDMANQLLLGHLPMLLHPDPKDVFVLGLGTGVSAAAIARYPVRSIEIVDIEAAAREATLTFAAENRDILSDPRVRLTVADGRNILLSRRRLYDVILSDPSDVWVAGVGNLLTREFYTLARSRLRPQGVMVQWFHMHSLPADQLKLLVATFQSVFPHTTFWRPNRGDVILTGTVDSLPWDYPRLSERVQSTPGVAADLRAMGLWDPLAIFAPFVLEGDDVKRLTGDLHFVHTDDQPILEYLSPRYAYVDTTTVNDAGVQSLQTVFIPPMTRFDPERDVTPRVTYLLGFGHASLGRTESAIRLMEDAVAREPGNAKYWIGLGNQYRGEDRRSRAADAYRRALELVAGEPEAAGNLAALLRADGDDAAAEKVLRGALASAPAEPSIAAADARLLLDTGRPGDAIAVLSPAAAKEPKNAELHVLLGLAFAATGQARDADRELRVACALAPDDAGLLRTAGKALLQVGNLAEAGAACARADLLEPGNFETLMTLAEIARRRGDAAGERSARERAAQVAPYNPTR